MILQGNDPLQEVEFLEGEEREGVKEILAISLTRGKSKTYKKGLCPGGESKTGVGFYVQYKNVPVGKYRKWAPPAY
jgi:hypothetical protein